MQLTTRQTEIADCLARGYSYKETANKLFISEHTVRNHIENIKINNPGTRGVVDIVRLFILQMEEPRKYFMVGLFLIIQATMTFDLESTRRNCKSRSGRNPHKTRRRYES
jgi:DNA-binding CsgD family transcriptional regulator